MKTRSDEGIAINISNLTYRKLCELKDDFIKKSNKDLTYDEIIKYLLAVRLK
jgi:hypothetical protein